jgi:hypothetical protein
MEPSYFSEKIPLGRALFYLFLSIMLFTVLPFSIFRFSYQASKEIIDSIIQTGPKKMALKTEYLCELIGLSSDRPTSIQNFDLAEAQKSLLASPLIEKATVKLVKPRSVYIDYMVREPIATLYDFPNIAIDKKGYIFPLYPFFTPKNLPEIYFGLSKEIDFTKPMHGKMFELSSSILTLFQQCPFIDDLRLCRIDLSQSEAKSYGRREIVILLEDSLYEPYYGREIKVTLPSILRLSTKNYCQELSNYFSLRDELWQRQKENLILDENAPLEQRLKEMVIDLRIPHLGYISTPEGRQVFTDSPEDES